MNHPEDDDQLADALARGPRTPAVRVGAGSMIRTAAVRSRRRRSMIQAGAAFTSVLVLAAGITIATTTQGQAPPVVAPPVLTSSTPVSSGTSVPSTAPNTTASPVSTARPVSTAPPVSTPSSAPATAASIEKFPAGTRMTFGSQDGKIRCASGDLRGLLIHCQTGRAAGELPGPAPQPCGDLPGSVAWGQDVALLPLGWAAFTCDADTIPPVDKKLSAGASLRIGDMTCTANSATEIRCRTLPLGKGTAASIVLRDGATVSAQPGSTFGKLDVDPTGRKFEPGFITRLTTNSLSFQPAYQYASRVGSDGYQLWWLPDMGAGERSVLSFPETEFYSCCSLGRDGVMGTVEGPDDYGTLRTDTTANQLMPNGTPLSPILVIQQRRGGEGAQFGAAFVYERYTSSQNTAAIHAITGQ